MEEWEEEMEVEVMEKKEEMEMEGLEKKEEMEEEKEKEKMETRLPDYPTSYRLIYGGLRPEVS